MLRYCIIQCVMYIGPSCPFLWSELSASRVVPYSYNIVMYSIFFSKNIIELNHDYFIESFKILNVFNMSAIEFLYQ